MPKGNDAKGRTDSGGVVWVWVWAGVGVEVGVEVGVRVGVGVGSGVGLGFGDRGGNGDWDELMVKTRGNWWSIVIAPPHSGLAIRCGGGGTTLKKL